MARSGVQEFLWGGNEQKTRQNFDQKCIETNCSIWKVVDLKASDTEKNIQFKSIEVQPSSDDYLFNQLMIYHFIPFYKNKNIGHLLSPKKWNSKKWNVHSSWGRKKMWEGVIKKIIRFTLSHSQPVTNRFAKDARKGAKKKNVKSISFMPKIGNIYYHFIFWNYYLTFRIQAVESFTGAFVENEKLPYPQLHVYWRT